MKAEIIIIITLVCFFINIRTLKCLLDAAKCGFYRAANSIFDKVGRTASEEVVLHLVKYKCMPILLYGFEVLNLNKSQLNFLYFVANRFLMKLFNTNNKQMREFCCEQFNFVLPSRQIANRRDKFIKSDSQRNNLLTFVNMHVLLLCSLHVLFYYQFRQVHAIRLCVLFFSFFS